MSSKISSKMHEKCEQIEKEKVKETYKHLKTKTLEDSRQKTKTILDWIGQGENSEKRF